MSGFGENVRVGQVWADNDPRCEGRTVMVMEISDGKAICSVAWPGPHKPRKRTSILLRRFRPNSTGYRLIADLPTRDDLTRSEP